MVMFIMACQVVLGARDDLGIAETGNCVLQFSKGIREGLTEKVTFGQSP